ncbi:MAG: TerB family tellurite resistance protein [Flavobacteriaceae bacterium]
MGFAKFVGAGLGWTVGGPIGGMLGFAFGSLIDGFHQADAKQFKKEQAEKRQSTKPGDFEVSLLILSALVIKADNKIDQRELDYVRTHFVSLFGKEKANNAFKIFNEIIKNNTVSTRRVCMQIQQHMDHPSRLQLLHYLFGIAASDDYVSTQEITELRKIAGYLHISRRDYDAIEAMFSGYNQQSHHQKANFDTFNIESAYKILNVDESATNDDIKKAYRRMAKKHHPDKIQHLGETHAKAAEEKFKKIKDAYEQLQTERNF